jgi:glycosyltransferase involved in cell wall biosynthesis
MLIRIGFCVKNMEAPKISTVMVVRNEEGTIEKSIKSVLGLSDEIIIVDGMSKDRTVEIARQYTEKIFQRPPRGYGDPDRAYGVSQSKNRWIFFLDADECLTEDLRAEISNEMSNPQFSSYYVPRINFMMGVLLKSTYPDYQLRLFSRDHVVIGEKIHGFITPKTTWGKMKNPIIHDTIRSLEQMVSRRENYTMVEARQLTMPFTRSAYFKYFILKPFLNFFRAFLLNRGIAGTSADWVFSFGTLLYNIEIAEKAWFLQMEGKRGKNTRDLCRA